jgi:hypothetical protein
MYYSNMRSHHAMLGDIVKMSHEEKALLYMVKKIDTIKERVYIVPMNNEPGFWVNASTLFWTLA